MGFDWVRHAVERISLRVGGTKESEKPEMVRKPTLVLQAPRSNCAGSQHHRNYLGSQLRTLDYQKNERGYVSFADVAVAAVVVADDVAADIADSQLLVLSLVRQDRIRGWTNRLATLEF